MRRLALGLVSLIASIRVAHAGQIVEIRDPRYFETTPTVLFPNAEVKLVTFEFESARGDDRGKQRARELHAAFLRRIGDLPGGAIVTYVTPPGQRIENYRVAAADVARQQHAQMALWGRVWVDETGRTLISSRLLMVQVPAGVSARYHGPSGAPPLMGVVDAPVTQDRIDFNTLEGDVTPLVSFLSGLARYYVGSARQGAAAKRWLESGVASFTDYLKRADPKSDPAAASQARLFLARSYVRLAAADSIHARQNLELARIAAEEAAHLNPYDASVPSVQAVIATQRGAPSADIRPYLVQASAFAPTDGVARVNLAMLDASVGSFDQAQRHLANAGALDRRPEITSVVHSLEGQLRMSTRQAGRLAGTWYGSTGNDGYREVLTLQQSGDTLTGSSYFERAADGTSSGVVGDIHGTVSARQVVFTLHRLDVGQKLTWWGEVDPNFETMKGQFDNYRGTPTYSRKP